MRSHTSIFRRFGRTSLFAAAAAGAVSLVAACGGSSSGGGTPTSSSTSGSTGASGSLVVAAAGFTESDVLADMYADLLNHAGFSAKVTQVESSEISQKSLEKGTVAVEPNYAATYANELQTEVTGTQNPTAGTPSLATTLSNIKKYGAQVGLTYLKPSQAVDQNAFAVTKTFASQHNLTTLSDLGKSGLPVTLAAPPECSSRPYCEPGLKQVYGINITKIDDFDFDSTAAKKAVEDGHDTMAEVGTTDATLSQFNLQLLTDDQHLQNADYLLPIVNAKVLQEHPQIATALNPLASVLTTQDLANLDNQVDNQRQLATTVAAQYLQQKGLL